MNGGYDFEGKVALVTGASRGIGRAAAVALARGGATVVLNYAGNEEAAREAARLVEEAGGRADPKRFDVADPEACKEAVAETVRAHGGLHILVNNAGISIDGLLLRLKDEDWNRTLAVNLTGVMNLCRAAARPMMKQKGGSIVNLSSVVAQSGNAGQAAYTAAKGGVISLTKTLARELASRKIRVNAVAPGYIETDMTGALPEEVKERMVEAIPLGRQGRPEEVAAAVAWLASDQSSYVTGHVLNVNGGMYM
ncbi:MAG: 3-oxoacyl-[acyl-carrier-protein] reductase [Deltaproteobacteria bacterium]|nr:MAG: 3-oxoacyl-[acyl-carrier-protein] reductase [Deltaproteobacteria bacterium]